MTAPTGRARAEAAEAVRPSSRRSQGDRRCRDGRGVPERLRTGKTGLVVIPTAGARGDTNIASTRTGRSRSLARATADSAFSGPGARTGGPGRAGVRRARRPVHRLPDSRAVGANLMGGGLWGVGFVVVDMRVRKLLKRFLATPMRRRTSFWR